MSSINILAIKAKIGTLPGRTFMKAQEDDANKTFKITKEQVRYMEKSPVKVNRSRGSVSRVSIIGLKTRTLTDNPIYIEITLECSTGRNSIIA